MSRLHVLRLNTRELLREPGTTRSIDVELPAAVLGIDDDRVTGDLDVELTATSSLDGIVVHGAITMPWRAPCRRCLTEVTGVAEIELDELYQDEISDEDAFEIEGDQIDLAPVVREYVLLELPDDPLCRDDCAGICPVCGIDRNQRTCDCDTTVHDERWAVLDQLRLDDDAG